MTDNSDNRDLIRHSAERIFGTAPAAWAAGAAPRAGEAAGQAPAGQTGAGRSHTAGATGRAALWDAVADAGFPLGLLSETEGGFGLSLAEALEPVICAAAAAAPVPLAETMLANWLLARSGEAPGTGLVLRVPAQSTTLIWGEMAQELLCEAPEGGFYRLSGPVSGGTPLEALSGEPMLRLPAPLTAAPGARRIRSGVSGLEVSAMAALLRAAQLAGALEAAVQLSLTYAQTRVQFGRSLGQFQVIQHSLAQMASHAAAARAGVAMAATAHGRADDRAFAALAAAAKIRAGEAVVRVADPAHQIHGALGFSAEYPLHHLTRRLWLWRELDGSDSDWARWLGRALQDNREAGLWPQITALQEEVL